MAQRSLFNFGMSKKTHCRRGKPEEIADTPKTPSAKKSKPDSTPGSASKVGEPSTRLTVLCLSLTGSSLRLSGCSARHAKPKHSECF